MQILSSRRSTAHLAPVPVAHSFGPRAFSPVRASLRSRTTFGATLVASLLTMSASVAWAGSVHGRLEQWHRAEVWFVGSSPQTAQQIEDSFKDTLALLEPHLAAAGQFAGHAHGALKALAADEPEK